MAKLSSVNKNERRKALAAKENHGSQIKHQLFGYAGVALHVAAQVAGIDRVYLSDDGNRRTSGRQSAHRKRGSPAALDIVRRRVYERHLATRQRKSHRL